MDRVSPQSRACRDRVIIAVYQHAGAARLSMEMNAMWVNSICNMRGTTAGLMAVLAASLVTVAGAAEPSAPALPVAGREQLHAVLWMQTSAEYRAAVEQTWRLATERLATALQPGSAALEQAGMDPVKLASLPTAVIVDLDETILDNSWYQARLARDGQEYNEASWQAWMAEAAAPALPGAREYLEAAARAGHRVFYLTNRECPNPLAAGDDPCPAKTATQRNLVAAGFPGAADPENLSLRGERPEWRGGDKSVRRAWLAERYRIVAIGGDDLRDFVDRGTYAARRAELAPMFGTRWFLLPNAMYGSWESAISQPACASGMPREECAQRKLERKYALLETQPPVPALAAPANRPWNPDNERVRIATWNIEYLVEPATYEALAGSCVKDGGRVPGAERRVPCDIVPRVRRDAADFATLRRYAAQLDADVLALQEVDGPAAARLVMPGYEFCFSSRPNVQKNGFAIRRGLPFRCEAEYAPISLGDRFRRGVVVTLFPGTAAEMTLMNVHLKSGCPAGPLNDVASENCVNLSAQVAPLEAWIDAQARAGRRFAVVGDFNRRLTAEVGGARDAAGQPLNLWPEIDDRDPAGADLVSAAEYIPFSKCVATDPYDSYVDQIVLGRDLARRWDRKSFERVTYTLQDFGAYKLSDHCPVGIDLSLQARMR
jgi:5'-nucleotidase (lipoprotein e(P4) family)